MGSSNENSGYGPVKNPWDRSACPAGRAAAPPRPWPPARPPGRSAPTPAAPSASPRRSAASWASSPPTARSRYGMIAFASSLDQCGPLTRDVTDAALLFRHMVGRDPCDSTSLEFPEEVALPSSERLDGVRFGVPGAHGARARAGRGARSSATLELIEELGGSVEEISLPHSSLRHLRLLRDRSGRGQRQPGALRRRPLRHARRGQRHLPSMYEQTRHEGFGAEVKRRIMLGTYALSSGYYEAYYGTAQKVRTKIADDFRAAFEHVDLIVTPTSPTVAFKLGERTAGPARDVHVRLLHGAHAAGRHPGDLDPRRALRGPAGGHPAGRARLQREPILDAAYALEQAIGFEGVPVRDDLRARHRPRDPRAAAHADEDVLRLRAQLRRRAQHPHLPRLPRPPGRAAGDERGGGPLRADDRPRAGLRHRAALDLPPQELLLSRPPEGLPDLPVRHPLATGGWATCVSIARTWRRTPPSPSHRGVRSHPRLRPGVVDFNRGGTPLVEIVTEPDLRAPEEAAEWLRCCAPRSRASVSPT